MMLPPSVERLAATPPQPASIPCRLSYPSLVTLIPWGLPHSVPTGCCWFVQLSTGRGSTGFLGLRAFSGEAGWHGRGVSPVT